MGIFYISALSGVQKNIAVGMSRNLEPNELHPAKMYRMGEDCLEQARRSQRKGDFVSAEKYFTLAKEKFKIAYKRTTPSNALGRGLLKDLLGGVYLERGDLFKARGLPEQARANYRKASIYLPQQAKISLNGLPPKSGLAEKSLPQSKHVASTLLKVQCLEQMKVAHQRIMAHLRTARVATMD